MGIDRPIMCEGPSDEKISDLCKYMPDKITAHVSKERIAIYIPTNMYNHVLQQIGWTGEITTDIAGEKEKGIVCEAVTKFVNAVAFLGNPI
jgi:ribosome maturation protein Sdo1